MFLCSLFSREDFQLILRRRKIINRLKSRTSNIAPCSNFLGVPPLPVGRAGQGACASRCSSTQPLQEGSGQDGWRPQHPGPVADPRPRGGCCPQPMMEHPRPLRSAPRCALQDWGHGEVGQSPRCSLLPVAAPALRQAPTVPCSTLRDGIVRDGMGAWGCPLQTRGQALQVLTDTGNILVDPPQLMTAPEPADGGFWGPLSLQGHETSGKPQKDVHSPCSHLLQ